MLSIRAIFPGYLLWVVLKLLENLLRVTKLP